MVIESLSVMFENWRSYINNLLLVFQSKGPRVLPKNTWQYSWWGLLFDPRNSESNALINEPPRLSHAVVPTNVSILTLLCSCSSAEQCSFSLIPDCIALDHRSQRPGKLLHQSCSERETVSNKTPTCLLLVIIFVVALLYIIYAEDWENFTISYLTDTGSPFGVVARITCSVILPPAAVHHHISQTSWRCIGVRNISLLLFRLWHTRDWGTHVVSGGNKHVWGAPSFIRRDIQFDLNIHKINVFVIT